MEDRLVRERGNFYSSVGFFSAGNPLRIANNQKRS
jgi:hypothetical protein